MTAGDPGTRAVVLAHTHYRKRYTTMNAETGLGLSALAATRWPGLPPAMTTRSHPTCTPTPAGGLVGDVRSRHGMPSRLHAGGVGDDC